LASISQQTPTDFETDLFLPGIKSLQMHSKFRYESDAYFSQDANQQRINKDFKVIVDHVKACIFAIADGALPSNKERGYVLRRLLRRAFVCARRLELTNGYLTDLTNTTISTMNNFYDYLQTASPKLIKIMEQENFIFQETLARGMKLFTDFVTTQKIDDEIVFKLVDTYGIPFELVQELANTHHIKINEMAFNKRLVDQQTTSRAHFDAKGMISQNAQLIKFITPSEFDYANLSNKHAKVAACFNRDFKQVEQLQTTGWVVFDQTVFYATSGGQDHDTGYVIFNDSKLEIIDVVKGPNGQHLHLINNLHSLSITKGDKFSLFVDKSHRLATSRNHTTEHLLQQALQTVIDPNIKQEGAFKSATKLTYDFHFHEKLSSNQLIKIQDQVNEYIKQAMPVTVTFASLEEAQNKGAKAYFVDVYKKIKGKLRLVDIHGNSLEICGGTHVTNTSDIEEFLITKLISIGSGS
jgi:alanyl-tRNA synthetase